MSASKTKWVRLGDYIERSMINNSDLKYGAELIEGVNSSGVFCTSKANTIDINLKPYKIVNNGDFVYNPSRLDIGSIAYRTQGMCIVSHLYVVFHLNEIGKKHFIPEFLFLYFKRKEFLRQVTFLNIGSQRPEFNFFQMSDIMVPLPPIDVQRELVDTYNGLKSLAVQNEALIEPLSKACEALTIKCLTQSNIKKEKVGNLITFYERVNVSGLELPIYGINKNKTFMPTVADTNNLNKAKYKLVGKNIFAFSGMQTGRDVCIRIAYMEDDREFLISPAYTTFKLNDLSKILPQFFFILFCRFEMDRLGWFLSDGSIRSNLDLERFCDIEIPLPPIEVQQSIVNLYHCMEEAKKIASEAREKLKEICPALIQKAIHQ